MQLLSNDKKAKKCYTACKCIAILGGSDMVFLPIRWKNAPGVNRPQENNLENNRKRFFKKKKVAKKKIKNVLSYCPILITCKHSIDLLRCTIASDGT